MVQSQSEKYIQGAILQGGGIANVKTNMPLQYADRHTQYMGDRARTFVSQRAMYATDFVRARVQGIDRNDFYRYFTTNVRLSDMHTSPTVTQQTDDTKNILFAEEKIDSFPIGAKLETMGSTWICTNPANLSGALTTAVVRRCNTSYNLYDYYGNILTEPIITEKVVMMGNDNDKPQNLVMMNGYFNVICQLNNNTKQLGLNQRIILGEDAYFITGYNKFYQEFSKDYDSTHILYYTVRIEEPNENDDVPNHIANGKTFSFSAKLFGKSELLVGQTILLTPNFIKNGSLVESTSEYPLSWTWISTNENIAQINKNGEVSAMEAGAVDIVAILDQNTNITATITLNIKSSIEPSVEFIGLVPQSIEQYETATLTAVYFENGNETDKPITWTFSGADTRGYKATINGNSVEIYCILADNIPLTVTATCEGKSVSTEIVLLGY